MHVEMYKVCNSVCMKYYVIMKKEKRECVLYIYKRVLHHIYSLLCTLLLELLDGFLHCLNEL